LYLFDEAETANEFNPSFQSRTSKQLVQKKFASNEWKTRNSLGSELAKTLKQSPKVKTLIAGWD
jgi:hypothetical protein